MVVKGLKRLLPLNPLLRSFSPISSVFFSNPWNSSWIFPYMDRKSHRSIQESFFLVRDSMDWENIVQWLSKEGLRSLASKTSLLSLLARVELASLLLQVLLLYLCYCLELIVRVRVRFGFRLQKLHYLSLIVPKLLFYYAVVMFIIYYCTVSSKFDLF